MKILLLLTLSCGSVNTSKDEKAIPLKSCYIIETNEELNKTIQKLANKVIETQTEKYMDNISNKEGEIFKKIEEQSDKASIIRELGRRVENINSFENKYDIVINKTNNKYTNKEIFETSKVFEEKNVISKLYEIYLNKINEEDNRKLKEELELLIENYIKENYLEKIKRRLHTLFKFTKIYIKSNELYFINSMLLNDFTQDKYRTVNDYLEDYDLKTKYEDNKLYIENTFIKLTEERLRD